MNWLITVLILLSMVATLQAEPKAVAKDYIEITKTRLEKESDQPTTPKHVVEALNHLIARLHDKGNYHSALMAAQQNLRYAKKVLGPEHPDTLTSLNNLAALYQAQGRYEEAEPLYQKALRLNEQVLGPEHPRTLTSLSNLATLYQAQGRYGEAEPLYQKALRLSEQVLGPEHPDTLASLNNLAMLYESQGRYGEAEPLYQKALRLSEKVLGPEHPDTLTSLNNLAALYQAQGRYGEAEPLYQKALRLREKVLGPEHPDTLGTQLFFAINQVNLNKIPFALQLLERLEPRLLELAALRLRNTHQERVRRQFLFSQSRYQDAVFTLALSWPDPRAVTLAARVMLRWKQIQTEEERFLTRFVRSRAGKSSPEIQALFDQIKELRGELGYLVNSQSKPDKKRNTLIQNKLRTLEIKEIRLAQLSREFKRHLEVRHTDVNDIFSALPERSILVELRRYWPINFKTGKARDPRFIALLMTPNREMSLHDLGSVSEIKSSWKKLRSEFTRDGAAELYQQLFGKLHKKLAHFETVYIAPDHFLNQVAFSRLITPNGKYWVENQTLRRLYTGRHLIMNHQGELRGSKGLVALGDVPYDKFVPNNEKHHTNQNKLQQLTASNSRILARAVLEKLGPFPRLVNTGPEVKAVARRYWDYWGTKPLLLLGNDATEHNLKSLGSAPRVLHLATHGFYLSNKESNDERRPMVLSGLALAGANRGIYGELGPDREDGILYALEAQDLNLQGTELVVLSACYTGTGTLDYSEGVYGLQRAFHIAGARNVLMSLWSLRDKSAKVFMERFYHFWLNGDKPINLASALRKTQLWFIKGKGGEFMTSPRSWAPYVLVEGG